MRQRRRLAEGEPDDGAIGASRGQILILFALFLVGLLGILGLAMDLGMAFAQRRTMQNAADAGALAGARVVARWTDSSPMAAQGEVQTMVGLNRMNTTPTLSSCIYVDYADGSEGSCSATVPVDATGVSVEVEETHATFFIRVVPGAPNSVTVRATATAHVQRLVGGGTGSPFIVCGVDTMLAGGGTFSIFSNAATGAVDPAAFDKTFVVHDPKSNGSNSTVEDCGIPSASFKGLADPDENGGLELNEWWHGDTGTKAGPTREKVNGTDGCANNVASPYDCVMLIPIATNDPPPQKQGNDRLFYVMAILAFEVQQTVANQHTGKLLDDYVVSGGGSDDWCRSCEGAVIVHLSS